ncbi:hypothetical protein JTE90_026064 [Oedothorax gibbosus]|uniref:Uncharacterized protein n=1 Tax=Oedothorax gibbosus TaxID=931172 RepID=A0AAV6UF44_9ARAC|nr:hypothetical protein JTE90_026064 [Oedothorax gibbosus]
MVLCFNEVFDAISHDILSLFFIFTDFFFFCLDFYVNDAEVDCSDPNSEPSSCGLAFPPACAKSSYNRPCTANCIIGCFCVEPYYEKDKKCVLSEDYSLIMKYYSKNFTKLIYVDIKMPSSKKSTESQKEESENESKEHGQSSEPEEPEPGSVQAMRQKFEAPSKKPTESHKEKSSRRSQKEESSRGARESGQKNKSDQQDSKPSGPVQAMRQKFEAALKKATEGQKEESSHGAKERQGYSESHQEPGSSGPVQAMRQKYEDLSNKSAKAQKKAPRQKSTGREQVPEEEVHERSKPSHTSKHSDERPPDYPDVAVKRRKRSPSFAGVNSSTPYDDSDFQRPLTDREPSGMDPEGMQLRVEDPKSKAKPKARVAPSGLKSITYDGPITGLSSQLSTTPKQEVRTAQDEFYERWYQNHVEKVEDYNLLNTEIHHLLSQYMSETNFDYDVALSAEVLVSTLKDFVENLYKKLRKANLELSETQESDISVKIHDHKRKALDAVSILEKQLEFSNNKITELKEQISDLYKRLNAAEEKNEYLQQAYQSSTTGSDQENLEMLETRITESMSEKYEQELSRLTDESSEQRHENNELYEQLIALVRERVESEEQYMRDLSDAEQKIELNSMLKEALFSVLGNKEPNPQDARKIVKMWYKDLQSVISENQKEIDGLLKKCESTRKTKEQLMSHCVELEDEIENLHFEIQTNKQIITSFLERRESSSAEIENITEHKNALKDEYQTKLPTLKGAATKRSFSPIKNPFGKPTSRDLNIDLNLPTPEPFELPPSSHWPRKKEKYFPVNKRGFKPTTPRLIQSSRPAKKDSFDRSYIPQPHFASQGGYDDDESFSFNRRVSITSPGKYPLDLSVGVKPLDISESASGEHFVCDIEVNIKEDQNSYRSPQPMESSTTGGAVSKRSFSPIENPFGKPTSQDLKIDFDLPSPESFEFPPSSHWSRAKENYFPVNKRGFKPPTPRLIQSSRPAKKDSFDRSYIPQPHFASQGGYDDDESFSFSRRVSDQSPGKDHSLSKTLSITSPGKDEPQQLNVEVTPRDICESHSGEHVFCQIDVNVKDTEQPIYEQESKQRRRRRRNVFKRGTPPLTPSTARDPRMGTPTSVFTKHHHGIRNLFDADIDIDYRPRPRGDASIEWETEPSVKKWPGYVREVPQTLQRSHVSTTPMNDSEEEDETSAQWNE